MNNKKKFSLFKTHGERLQKAAGDFECLDNWKSELTSRATEAAKGNNLKEKFEVLGEMLMAGLADNAQETLLKTKALAVVMRDRHGLKDEEIEKWLNGTSLIPRPSFPITSPITSTNSKK